MFRPKTKLSDSAFYNFKSFVQNKKQKKGRKKEKKKKKKKKKKVFNFNKIEYYKEVLDFRNIEYHITFLITQLPGQ